MAKAFEVKIAGRYLRGKSSLASSNEDGYPDQGSAEWAQRTKEERERKQVGDLVQQRVNLVCLTVPFLSLIV